MVALYVGQQVPLDEELPGAARGVAAEVMLPVGEILVGGQGSRCMIHE